MQALSHVSEVLYGAALLDKMNPVEVQAGRAAERDKRGDLFLSANDADTQDWMHGAMGDPLALVHRMASLEPKDIPTDKKTTGESVDRARKSALKILFNLEQKKERLRAIKAGFPGPRNRKKRNKLNKDLGVVDEIFHNFLSGNAQIVHNKAGKHAEQNIAAAMYDSVEPHYTRGEIGGTKIRCEGCSSELGTNTTTEEGKPISGKGYAAQASHEKHAETLAALHAGEHLIAMGPSQRPGSPSPVKAAEGQPRTPVDYSKAKKKSAELAAGTGKASAKQKASSKKKLAKQS